MYNFNEIANNICKIGRNIWNRQFCAGNEGNISVRLNQNDVACTPTGISKGFLTEEMIGIVSYQTGLQTFGSYKMTSEVKIHLAIYEKCPDVNAIIHAHPPHASAFALAGINLPEAIHPEAEVFLGRVQFAKYATPSKMELAETLIPLLTPATNTIIMQNHGVVCFSNSLEDAYYKLEILDAYCKMLLLTKTIGGPKVLDETQFKELLEVKKNFGVKDNRTVAECQAAEIEKRNQAFFEAIK